MNSTLSPALVFNLNITDTHLADLQTQARQLALDAMSASIIELCPDAHFAVLKHRGTSTFVSALINEDGRPLWALNAEPPGDQHSDNPFRLVIDKYAAALGAEREVMELAMPLHPRWLGGDTVSGVFLTLNQRP